MLKESDVCELTDTQKAEIAGHLDPIKFCGLRLLGIDQIAGGRFWRKNDEGQADYEEDSCQGGKQLHCWKRPAPRPFHVCGRIAQLVPSHGGRAE